MAISFPRKIRGLVPRDLFSPAFEGSNVLVTRETIPAVCYEDCNAAYKVAQSIGKIPSLCEAGSSFRGLYQACADCITSEVGSKTTLRDYLEPQFSQFIGYCDGISMQTGSKSATTSTLASCSDCSTILITNYQGNVITATLGPNDITAILTPVTVTQTNTVTYFETRIADSATSPTAGPPEPTESLKLDDPSSGVKPSEIVGPVVPTVVVIIVLGFFGMRWYQRRRKTQMAIRAASRGEETGYEKAQLPDDPGTRPVLHELEGSAPPRGEAAEVPANEPPAHVMPTEEQRRGESEN